MHRNNSFHLLVLVMFATLSLIPLRGDPLILAEPVGKSAFLSTGAANVTFDVEASSSSNTTLNYYWQYKSSSGSFSNCTDNTTFNGSTTANLTVNNTDTSLNGYKFKCFITDSNSTVNTFGVTLNVYTTPSLTPNVSVAPSSIAANSTSNITITITGMNPGSTVRLQQYLDIHSNGVAEISDPLVADFQITDGQKATFGGVTDPIIPGDEDGAADGNITTHITLPTSTEFGKAAGQFIIKVSNTLGQFQPVSTTFTVTQPAYGQSVIGQVLNGSTPVPNALVGLLTQDSGGNTQFVAGTVANSTGNFTLSAPTGQYALLAFVSGYVASIDSAPQFELSSSVDQTNQNPILTSATRMITGNTNDSSSGNPVRGLQLINQSDNNEIVITTSNNDGNYTTPVTAGNWTLDFSDNGLPRLGYLRPSNQPTADTTTADVTLPITLEAVDALIYGNVTKSGGTPIADVLLDADDGGNNSATAHTDANGIYYLGVHGGGGTNWNVSPDNDNPALNGLVPFSGNNYLINGNTATLANFTAVAATAFLNGTVTNNGSPVANLSMQATESNSSGPSTNVDGNTDSNGNFSLGVFGGNWTLQINYGDNNTPTNLIGQSLSYNVTDNVNITNIAFLVINSTATISGNVLDANNQPVTQTSVTASANISGNFYFVSEQTDGSGNYSLPVVNGTWTVNVPNTGTNYASQTITVNGTSQMANFSASPYAEWQASNFNSTQLSDPSISGVNAAPGGDGIPNLAKYAFNLQPFVNQRQDLPTATLSSGKLTLVFNAIRSDVIYSVEASTDMSSWSATGVTIQTSGQQVTATYDLTGHAIAFLRIVVTLND